MDKREELKAEIEKLFQKIHQNINAIKQAINDFKNQEE